MVVDQPNAEQARWRSMVADAGSVISHSHEIQIHHCAGRRAIQNKIPIGHEFILALTPYEHHLIDKGTEGLDELQADYIFNNGDPGEFEFMRLHDFEKFLFKEMCDQLLAPFGADVMEAIQTWRR